MTPPPATPTSDLEHPMSTDTTGLQLAPQTIVGTERVAIASLVHYPGNARVHDLDLIRASLRELGQYRQVVALAGTREVLAGNGTMEAAAAEGWTHLDVTWVDVDPVRARKIVAVDNRANDVATYDDRLLAELLEPLADDLGATGYDTGDLDALLAGLGDDVPLLDTDPDEDPDDDPEATRHPDAGTLLMLADVSVAAPTYTVEAGQVWEVGPHLLAVAKVHTGWEAWLPLLAGLGHGAVLVPYPGPYTALTETAERRPLLLVQPDLYLAGHVLQKYAAIHGPDAVTLRPATA